MSEGGKRSSSNGFEKPLTTEDQQAWVNGVRRLVGPLPDKIRCPFIVLMHQLQGYLRARNWNAKKALKMLKETLKWRAAHKPEEIRWEEVAHEAQTGKIYRSNYFDKHGRTVLAMRPSCQNSKSIKGQIKYLLVYCMENAILNLPPEKEQLVWLVDFNGFNLSHISLKETRETAHVLQDHYPECLGLAILYNPPKFFEPFWMLTPYLFPLFSILHISISQGAFQCVLWSHSPVLLVAKAFLEPKTYNKVKFVYAEEINTMKIMEDLFDMDHLEAAFGGKGVDFDISEYAERMTEDDKRMPSFWTRVSFSPAAPQPDMACTTLDSLNLDSDSDASDNTLVMESIQKLLPLLKIL
uniref:CRAL-TRIO domain-containing protein n=1 Tax=Populus trichocarpa TaxID=3694 RepID=A0A2K2AHT4_POPTR